ncbi:hypothetical protein [Chamaesiphon sp. VAR_48_metabat_135_sub]|nr:hypothetical protein [Chamaesiphon sp. VAR_48_metabat_135_sub]
MAKVEFKKSGFCTEIAISQSIDPKQRSIEVPHSNLGNFSA